MRELTPEQAALKDKLLANFDKIMMIVTRTAIEDIIQFNEPRVLYFNPQNCSFHICLPDGQTEDIPLLEIREVHLH